MFTTPTAAIDFARVEEFCRRFPEGVRVEYKEQLTKIPRVVSSFANSVGGVWIIGVETDSNNMPVFPIKGMPKTPGIEEQIVQSCITGIYPAITPEVKVIESPADRSRVVVVVKVFESIEAPHAIENSTKVFVRIASLTQPYDLADIDRIAYLLRRRVEPERRREELIASAVSRSAISDQLPRIRILVSPVYPRGPIISLDELFRKAQELSYQDGGSTYMVNIRRSHNAVLSSKRVSPSMRHHFEADANGVVFCEDALELLTKSFRGQEFRGLRALTILYPVASVIRLAQRLLIGRTTNLLVRVEIFGAVGLRLVVRGDYVDPELAIRDLVCVDPHIEASTPVILELLDHDFVRVVATLLQQVYWAFNYVEQDMAFVEHLLRVNRFIA